MNSRQAICDTSFYLMVCELTSAKSFPLNWRAAWAWVRSDRVKREKLPLSMYTWGEMFMSKSFDSLFLNNI